MLEKVGEGGDGFWFLQSHTLQATLPLNQGKEGIHAVAGVPPEPQDGQGSVVEVLERVRQAEAEPVLVWQCGRDNGMPGWGRASKADAGTGAGGGGAAASVAVGSGFAMGLRKRARTWVEWVRRRGRKGADDEKATWVPAR